MLENGEAKCRQRFQAQYSDLIPRVTVLNYEMVFPKLCQQIQRGLSEKIPHRELRTSVLQRISCVQLLTGGSNYSAVKVDQT